MRDAASNLADIDLTGRWRVIHDVERSDRSGYLGLKIEFQLSLVQDGRLLTGDGEKFLVEWELATREETSRLEISGHVNGVEIRLSLRERSRANPERTFLGEILWRAVNPDHMIGSFKVDIAATAGRSEAFRRLP